MNFLKRYKDRIIVASVTIILLVLIGISSNRLELSKGEKIVGNIFTPVSKVTFNIGKSVSDFLETIFNFTNIKTENEELKEYIIRLEDENRNLIDLVGKSDILTSEAEILKQTSHNIISAQITGMEPGSWFNSFTIDKGLNHGVQNGHSVIQGVQLESNVFQEGIIGRVTEVGDNWAKVVSIIDDNSNISFKVTRTQDGGILSGSLEGHLSGYLFDYKGDVIVGDTIYTSGLGGVFQRDLYIGQVREVIEVEDQLTKHIVVTPAIDFMKIQDVLVIRE